MKNDEELLDRLIREKEFNQLTTDERDFVLRLMGSEEEFQAMRKVEFLLQRKDLKSNLEPEPQLLTSLKSKMQKQNSQGLTWSGFFGMKVPAYAAVLLVIVFSSIVFWLRSPVTSPQTVLYPSLTKSDTVFITKTDTVFREKVIYRQVNFISTPKQNPFTNIPEKQLPASEGVSMKEKEELNKLLVSGSE